MLRAVLAVIAGYASMALTVMICLTGAYLALGADGSFQPGTYEPSLAWIIVMFVVGLVAAVEGGIVVWVIARRPKVVTAMMIVVAALGVLSAIPAFLPPAADAPTERTGDVSSFEAATRARTPAWVAILNPVIGVAGVWMGSQLLRQRRPEAGGPTG